MFRFFTSFLAFIATKMTMMKRCIFLLFITVVIFAQDEQAVKEPNDNGKELL